MTSDDMAEAFKSAREDEDVRAVILRVNSPGGSMLASELIGREVELTAKKKPVVVSMSGYAASGGYMISIPAAKIIAEPGTITGSIGVLGGKFNVTPAAQKIFANTDAVSRGANVGMFDTFTDFTPEQAKQFQDDITRNYQYFLKLVAAGRHITVDQADAVAQGRVWTGEQAVKLKLVDSLGGLDEAIATAKGLARLAPDQPVSVIELPEQPGLLQTLSSGKMVAAAHAAPVDANSRTASSSLIRVALSGHAIFSAAILPGGADALIDGGRQMDAQLEGFLNVLAEAERAGGRVLHELTELAQSLELREMLKKVGHDEGYYAGELAAHVRRLGGNPSTKTGDFVEKIRAIGDFRGKLELLNRGQRWVIRRIEENVPTIGDPPLEAFLVVMAEGHRVNIGALEDALKQGVV